MRRRSIGVRLTTWYAVFIVAVFALTGVGTWLDMRDSVYDMVDDHLQSALQTVQQRLAQAPAGDERATLRMMAAAGGPRVSIAEPGAVDPSTLPPDGVSSTRMLQGAPTRVLTAPVVVGGQAVAVEIGESMAELYETLDDLRWGVILITPMVLVIACVGGYWMSRKALAPIEHITSTAQTIGAHTLEARLPVDGNDDELDRLSATLNGMFARLDSAFNQVRQFTADASHELRTPVAIIKTTAEVARSRPRTEVEYRRALEQVIVEADRTARLIDSLLALARADAAIEPPAREPLRLDDAVREACAEGALLAEALGVRLSADVAQPVVLRGDAQSIRRMCQALIENAVKYTPAGGSVVVTLMETAASARLEVRDTGIGIENHHLPHIFDRFYRVSADRGRTTGGFGLGLSIANMVATAHGARLVVESAPGAGSVFRVEFPVESVAFMAPSESAAILPPEVHHESRSNPDRGRAGVAAGSGEREEDVDGQAARGSAGSHQEGSGGRENPRPRG